MAATFRVVMASDTFSGVSPSASVATSLDRTSNKGQDAVLTERFINLRRQPGVQMVRRAIERERHSLRMIYDL